MAAFSARALARGALFFLCFTCVFVAAHDAQAIQSQPSFFGTREVKSTNLKPFKKWNGALARFSREMAIKKKTPCGATELNKCNYLKWMAFLKDLRGKPPLAQIKAVNSYMNRAPYITDMQNWGVQDYWETPNEFMARFGDCEDYAIAKYISLKFLGFKEDDLRVVALKDLNLKIGHAVLVVFFKGKTLVLDNQIRQVVQASTIHHYLPVFSINAKAWWRHIKP
ncbi:transglutaminase-like cysteine peptidase [Varunaivibrio sulfuroxidans]|nr:transglutaminase-like cysteine peptidase [Varunaivibrio sulfuroxidans]WES31016.1 transglutaminase-like cysteine peptidase [Varunaivibrio sulfuroxidans]